jgi:hypothetical protein
MGLFFIKNSSSGAQFSVFYKNGIPFIKKSVFGKAHKLSEQYQWLKERENFDFIPYVENPVKGEYYFSYDMKYYEDHFSFIDIINSGDVDRCKIILSETVRKLNIIHKTEGLHNTKEEILDYIDVKILKKIEHCLKESSSLQKLDHYKQLIVNGKSVPNFNTIKERLQDSKLIELLEKTKKCDVHGDATVENTLVDDKNRILLVDCNNENGVSSFHLDYGKLFQSLHSDYESLCLLPRVEIIGNRIEYISTRKPVKQDLYKQMTDMINKKYDPETMLIVLFHEVAHFARLLPYRLEVNRKTGPAFYSVFLLRLDELIQRVNELK